VRKDDALVKNDRRRLRLLYIRKKAIFTSLVVFFPSLGGRGKRLPRK
jgi:hypothetical protein